MYKKFTAIFIVIVLIITNSCIDDNVVPPLTGNLESAGEMLIYFESLGDFANSSEAPALVSADEVYTNLDDYLIIDIRSTNDFQSGHIEGSLNVSTDSLYNFFRTTDVEQYNKVIIVSRSGQSAAYFTCLLRLAGYDNVYTMNFGLASWNEFFADEWLNALGEDENISIYTNVSVPKEDFADLPEITIENPDATLKQIADLRIKKIMAEGFVEETNFVRRITNLDNNYLICYGRSRLYTAPRNGPLGELGHDPRTVFYISDPVYELRSVNYLQSLPTDRRILLYDETGQNGACMAAYLRVLGYNAVTILFGGNHLIYARIIGDPEISEFAFDNNDIKNYPYITE